MIGPSSKTSPYVNVTEIQMNGAIYSNHPCYRAFYDNLNMPLEGGYVHPIGQNKLFISGKVSAPFDPRFECLRNTKQGISRGQIKYVNAKTQKTMTPITVPAKQYPSALQIELPAKRKMCMYSADGKYLCRPEMYVKW